MKCIREAYSEIYRLSGAVTSRHELFNAIMVAHNSVVDLDDYEYLADIESDLVAIIDAWDRDVAEVAIRDPYAGHGWIVVPVSKVLNDLHEHIIYVRAYGE